MPGIPIKRKTGPRSWEVVEAVAGGQLCEGRAASKIGVAAAGTFKFLGVAIADAVPALAFSAVPVNGVLNANPSPNRAGLAYGGDEVPVIYLNAAGFGDKLIAAAAGKATPAGVAPDARTIVGTCTEPGGVLAGAVGLMRTV